MNDLLKQRVITALVLLLICLPALTTQSAWPFLALTWIMSTLAAWEWARMNTSTFLKPPLFALLTLALCALDGFFAWSGFHAEFQALGLILVWLVFFAMVLKWGIEGWSAVSGGWRQLMGLIMLLGAWASFNAAKVEGTHFLISVLVLVWTADIGAYFVGKAFGKTKLAPIVSPGKSREGALGGLVLVLLLGLIWAQIESLSSPESQSIYAFLWHKGPVHFVLGLSALVACSVLGDLFESLVKRSAGFKDSSQLLPGHGGVLDRIDALLPTVPLALLLVHGVL